MRRGQRGSGGGRCVVLRALTRQASSADGLGAGHAGDPRAMDGLRGSARTVLRDACICYDDKH